MPQPMRDSDQFVDEDDDDDDDFFIGNMNNDDEYSVVENVYVEFDPKERSKSKPKESSDLEEQSDSSGDAVEKRTRVQSIGDIDSDEEVMIIDSPRTTDHESRNSIRQTRNSSRCIEVRSRSPTPPPKRRRTHNYPSIAASLLETDENDEFFREIAKEAKRTPSGARETTPDQPRRIYNVRFISKLDGSIDKAVQLKVLGKYDFASVLPSVLNGFMKEYKIPIAMKKIYVAENVVLYWKTAKLLNFMTCNSLKIPQAFDDEISEIEITIVSKECEKAFEENMSSNFLEGELIVETGPEVSNSNNADSRVEEFEKELKGINELTPNDSVEYIDLDNQDDTGLIKIALVGQDNKKLFVNVRRSTKLHKVSEYYRKKKLLQKEATLKLVFDHEELDVDGNIGDQDLEDGDMIEVVLK